MDREKARVKLLTLLQPTRTLDDMSVALKAAAVVAFLNPDCGLAEIDAFGHHFHLVLRWVTPAEIYVALATNVSDAHAHVVGSIL